MEFEESIYNLIPRERYEPAKQKQYKSSHPSNVPPTGSTFGHVTTSKPGVGNLNGDYQPEGSNHLNKAMGATFGQPKGTLKPDANTFRKKGTGTMVLPQAEKYTYAEDYKKQAVPKKNEKPIMGLVSDKNFIVANAVENILAAPKMKANTDKDYLKKKAYGKVPNYLQKIKNEIEDEYQLVREMQIEEENEKDKQKFLLPDDERQELIEALKKKWEIVHREYQTLTHKSKLDTLGIKNKKENCEKELHQLEKDIEKLTKNYIFVDTMNPSSIY